MPDTTCHTRLLMAPVDSWIRRKKGSSRGRTMKTSAMTPARTAVTTAMSVPFSRKSTGKKSPNRLSEFGMYMIPGPEERAHVVEVIRGPGDQVPRLVRHVEGVVQLQEAVVDPLAKAVLDIAAMPR